MHTTNYFDTLICPAEDCKSVAKVPDNPDSIAGLQYEKLTKKPYALTSDDILVSVATMRKGIAKGDTKAFREAFFSKGQPCFRASPLTKTHGWAIHADKEGRLSLVDPRDGKFKQLFDDKKIAKVNAMRNKRL